jgi:hypothetical protein
VGEAARVAEVEAVFEGDIGGFGAPEGPFRSGSDAFPCRSLTNAAYRGILNVIELERTAPMGRFFCGAVRTGGSRPEGMVAAVGRSAGARETPQHNERAPALEGR